MHKEPPSSGVPDAPTKETADPERDAPWFETLAQTKLSPLIVIGFIAALAVVSAAATGVSYVVHHFARY